MWSVLICGAFTYSVVFLVCAACFYICSCCAYLQHVSVFGCVESICRAFLFFFKCISVFGCVVLAAHFCILLHYEYLQHMYCQIDEDVFLICVCCVFFWFAAHWSSLSHHTTVASATNSRHVRLTPIFSVLTCQWGQQGTWLGEPHWVGTG